MRVSWRSIFQEQTASEKIEIRVASVIDLMDEAWEDEIETKKRLTRLVLDGDVSRKEANSQSRI